MTQWHVLPVAAQRELFLEKRIRALGYGAIAPWDESQRRVRGCYRPWKFPLYVGYVFVCLPAPAEDWQRLRAEFNTEERRLVFRLLGGETPAVLAPADVAYLQSIADGRYQDAAKSLVVGDTVIVPDGHLQGRASIVTKIRHSKRRGARATVRIIGDKNDITQEFPLASLVKV